MNLFHSTVTYTCNKYVSNGITILHIFICTAFFFNKDQDGSSLKEALLSGSPGVGKTTTATITPTLKKINKKVACLCYCATIRINENEKSKNVI